MHNIKKVSKESKSTAVTDQRKINLAIENFRALLPTEEECRELNLQTLRGEEESFIDEEILQKTLTDSGINMNEFCRIFTSNNQWLQVEQAKLFCRSFCKMLHGDEFRSFEVSFLQFPFRI